MYYSGYGLGYAALLLGGWAIFLLIAHIGWLITLWTTRLGQPFPTLAGAIGLLIAAVTPLIGFYALLIWDRLHGQGDRPRVTPWWRWLLPGLSVASLWLAAWRAEQIYAPEYRSASHISETMGLLGVYFVILTLTLHMAAMVFGTTVRGPLTSRSQLIICGVLLPLPF